MAKMKNRSRLGQEDVQKMVREYWEVLESEQREKEILGEAPALKESLQPKVKS